MKKEIKIYNLKDPRQYEDEKKFWNEAGIEFKLNALEVLRESYFKIFNINKDEISRRLRSFYRVIEQKGS